ncbi:MAPEG family protein, partial [Salmonella sp. s55004]|uniref:MAPEG family protein n=1 Tax=Salmonella sp. s55004 TaxID=3159675 RepID=UPI003980B7E0
TVNERVARIKRCHLNDLENIPSFLIVGLMFVAIDPSLFAATMHYRIFVISRFVHNLAYLLPLPQPCRGLGFMVGTCVTVSMAVQILQAVARF